MAASRFSGDLVVQKFRSAFEMDNAHISPEKPDEDLASSSSTVTPATEKHELPLTQPSPSVVLSSNFYADPRGGNSFPATAESYDELLQYFFAQKNCLFDEKIIVDGSSQDPMLPVKGTPDESSQAPPVKSMLSFQFPSSQGDSPGLWGSQNNGLDGEAAEAESPESCPFFIRQFVDPSSNGVSPTEPNPVPFGPSGDGPDGNYASDFAGGLAPPYTQVPSTSSTPALDTSSTEDPGKWGFRIRFPKHASGRNYVFREEDKKLFVKSGAEWDVELMFDAAPPPSAKIFASAVHQDQGKLNEPVEVCPLHERDKHARNTPAQFLSSSMAGVEHRRSRVIIPLTLLKKNGKGPSFSCLARFRCKCNNSCYKAKSAIRILFSLMDGQKLIGQAGVDIRSCACPLRDSDSAVKNPEKKKRGTKRKADDAAAVKEEALSPAKATADGTKPGTSAASGDFVVTSGDCGRAKRMKRGICREYYIDGDVLCLDIHVRSSLSMKNYYSTHLMNFETMAESAENLNLQPGKPVSLEQLVSPRQGIRTVIEVPNRRQPSPVHLGLGARELKSWLRNVVQVDDLSQEMFTNQGVQSLDALMNITKERLEHILPSVKTEVIEKLWHYISHKVRGSSSSLPSQNSQ